MTRPLRQPCVSTDRFTLSALDSKTSKESMIECGSLLRSHTIAGHFVRGFVGFGFLAILLVYGSSLGWWTLIPAAGALLAFRG